MTVMLVDSSGSQVWLQHDTTPVCASASHGNGTRRRTAVDGVVARGASVTAFLIVYEVSLNVIFVDVIAVDVIIIVIVVGMRVESERVRSVEFVVRPRLKVLESV